MHLNAKTAILCDRILLVPYQASHVETYSQWMSDEALREATASERLSLEDEYAMQKSWREDPDKLTFITALSPEHVGIQHIDEIEEGLFDTPETLVGDVNLFLCEITDDDEDEDNDNDCNKDRSKGNKDCKVSSAPKYSGEVELMVAVPGHRGKGMGKAALLSFLRYILEHADELAEQIYTSQHPQEQQKRQQQGQQGQSSMKPEFAKLTVKINKENIKSLGLFDSVGFERKGGPEAVNYFGEVEFEMVLDANSRTKIETLMTGAGIGNWRKIKYTPTC